MPKFLQDPTSQYLDLNFSVLFIFSEGNNWPYFTRNVASPHWEAVRQVSSAGKRFLKYM